MCLSPTHPSFQSYNQEIQTILQSNQPYFEKYIQERYTDKFPMVIFDIDDTLLSTVGMGEACFLTLPRIKPVVEFYYWLKRKGYRIVLITARQENVEAITKANLQKEGIVGYDHLFTRNLSDMYVPIGNYKLNKRKMLSNQYDIVGNIGDQITDFYGGYSGRIIKLPNYSLG